MKFRSLKACLLKSNSGNSKGIISCLLTFILIIVLVWHVDLKAQNNGLKDNPTLEFLKIPSYGSNEKLIGRIRNADPNKFKVAVYIFNEGSGWWTKPNYDNPLISIQSDCTWTVDIINTDQDLYSSRIKAYLLPNGVTPPLIGGTACLPEIIKTNSIVDIETTRKLRTIFFSGYEWQVKASKVAVGPGPNLFSDSPENVWIDVDNNLHLKITHRNGQWFCSEVILNKSLGYGRYVFKLASKIGQINENAILGIFTWDNDGCAEHHREIDIEFSRWGNANDTNNAQYVIQPYTNPANIKRFNIELNGDYSTHIFDCQPDTIFFQSVYGHYLSPPDSNYLIQSWIYSGKDTPPAGGENARINFWLFRGEPPSDGKEAEVIIKAFEFVP